MQPPLYRWEVERNWKDDPFKVVDNQKMAVSGKYTLIEPGNVRFEIFPQGSPSEIVNGIVALQGDVLTFICERQRN